MFNVYKESDYEQAVMELFGGLGYQTVSASDIECDFKSPLYDEVLEEQIWELNPILPQEAIDNALYKLRNFDNGELVQKNEIFMDYLQNGIEVKYSAGGEERAAIVYVVDYENIERNSFIAANQWTFTENSTRRLDIILFLNGLPVVIIELKSPSREETDISEAYRQIRNYMQEIPSMFIYNAFCVISDLALTKAGTITSGIDRFMEWKTKETVATRILVTRNSILSLKEFFSAKGFWTYSRTLSAFQMKAYRRTKSLPVIINTLQ